MECCRPNSFLGSLLFHLGQKIWPNLDTSVDMVPLGVEDTTLSVSKLAVC